MPPLSIKKQPQYPHDLPSPVSFAWSHTSRDIGRRRILPANSHYLGREKDRYGKNAA
jgi:hypothetical protein